jgi:hypothetical protein
MSQITMLANTTGTGVFTIQTPGTNTNRTITLPDATGTVLTTDSLNVTGSAPMFACRAWVNFNGSGTVSTNQTIRASGNIASVFKNSSGNYTVTFTTAMVDTNYAICGIGQSAFSGYPPDYDIVSQSAGSFTFQTKATGSSVVLQDPVIVTLAVFR